jgi:hypothetical protein
MRISASMVVVVTLLGTVACSDGGSSGGGAASGGTAGSSAAGGAGGSGATGGAGGNGGSGAGGPLPSVGGCTVFPASSPWNTPITDLPEHPRSAEYIASFSSEGETTIRLDLGVTETEYGIPYNVVPEGHPLVPIRYGVDGEDYGDESDPGPYPVPLDARIEGQAGDVDATDGDRHLLVIQSGACLLYELYRTVRESDGFRCSSSAKWDLKTDSRRTPGWTSADAAGLPIFAGLLRWEEVEAGAINHAIRITAPRAQKAWVDPASHAGPNEDASTPPYGLRLRLDADYDETPYSAQARVILRAFKTYGVIFADQGTGWYVTGTQNPGWEDVIGELNRQRPIPGNRFKAVRSGDTQCKWGAPGACQ